MRPIIILRKHILTPLKKSLLVEAKRVTARPKAKQTPNYAQHNKLINKGADPVVAVVVVNHCFTSLFGTKRSFK